MSNSVYVATTDPRCGKSVMSLGIVDLLLRRTSRVGVFRPVIRARSPEEKDKNIDLLLSHFGLDLKYEDTFAFLRSEARRLIAQGSVTLHQGGAVTDPVLRVPANGVVLRIGKRRFLRIVPKP